MNFEFVAKGKSAWVMSGEFVTENIAAGSYKGFGDNFHSLFGTCNIPLS